MTACARHVWNLSQNVRDCALRAAAQQRANPGPHLAHKALISDLAGDTQIKSAQEGIRKVAQPPK